MEFYGLVMHEFGHVIAYSLGALLVYLLRKDFLTLRNYFIGLGVTLLMDTDHFIDYFLHTGFRFNFYEFFTGMYFNQSGKVYLFLHSWELVGFLLLLFLVIKNKLKYSWLLFVALGVGVHLLYDMFYYSIEWRSYLLYVRLLQDFSIGVF